MRTDIIKILQMKQFFTILQSKDNSIQFNLKEPSRLLVKNIHANWLQYNHIKTDKHHIAVHLNESSLKLEHVPSIFGIINQELQEYNQNSILEVQVSNNILLKRSLLKLDLIVPQQDAMQYLIQWQRYRKYWWSSISTTPSLFSVNEFKCEDNSAKVDIVAQLPSVQQPVENLSFKNDVNEKSCRLTCSMCLEDALFILLLDGVNHSNSTNEDYLRLHRKIAPFKISFAINLKEKSMKDNTLCKLATLLYHKLETHKIPTWLPDFTLPINSQIKANLKMGVIYTAILDEETLKHGILKLMNSSTKLVEHVHVADFCKYAALIFESKA